MKRSDVIHSISSSLYELNVDLEECDDLANDLLTKLEWLGMLPPSIVHPKIPKDMSELQYNCEKAKEEVYNYSNLPDRYKINEWEPE